MIKVALYARVSSDDEGKESVSIAGQLREMRKYAESQEWEIYHEFTDNGLSGRNDHRPGFQELVRQAQQSPTPFEILLVWSYSRFSRNYENSRLYRAILKRYDIFVVSATEPFAEPVVRLLDAIAEFVCSDNSKYTKMAMRELAIQGYSCGGIPPFGYHRVYKDRKSHLEPHPKHSKTVERIFQLFLKGNNPKNAKILLFRGRLLKSHINTKLSAMNGNIRLGGKNFLSKSKTNIRTATASGIAACFSHFLLRLDFHLNFSFDFL